MALIIGVMDNYFAKLLQLFAIAILARCCQAHLNVYLSQYEVMRLLGLSAELYYVREGQINDYALNFVVPVPADIGELHFTWQSLTGRPLPYTITVDVSDRVAMQTPVLNVSRRGSVPTSPQTWRLQLPCSGRLAAEVDVSIALNVSVSNSAATALHFRRKKICLKEEPRAANPGGHVSVEDAPSGGSTSAGIFYAAVGCAIGALVVACAAMATCRARGRKARRPASPADGSQATRAFLAPSAPPSLAPSYASCRRMPGASGASASVGAGAPTYAAVDERARDLHERISELTIQRCRVRLRSVALEGTFGRVYRGTYAAAASGGAGVEEEREQEVLVKTVTEHASQGQVSLLLQEGMSMYGLTHERVLSVLGVSIEDHTAPFLIYPYAGYRNMKRFLQQCKMSPEGPAHTLTTQEVVDMALQAVEGLAYLHKKHIVHKDVAARNCVVDERLRVQIADNALSRDLFPADYHCLGDNENRPVKWLACEALVARGQRSFGPAADVWSLGVLLWELTSLAQQPYAEVDPFEMAAYLRDGYRLAQPVNCPDELFAVMAYCWAAAPDARPTLHQLQLFLQDFLGQLTRYV